MKMNPEVKARWVAALRSGKYKQGSGCLRKEDDSFCCLGVLCDLRDPEAWGVTVKPDDGLPPTEIDEWSGLSCMATVQIRGVEAALYSHNDNGATFAEIADAIEEQL